MRTIITAATMLILTLAALSAPSEETKSSSERQTKLARIESLNEELKPLRIHAMHETDVIKARKASDEALRQYYSTLRAAMARLDPAQKRKIEELVKLRKEVHNGSSGSRAEDYEASTPSEKH